MWTVFHVHSPLVDPRTEGKVRCYAPLSVALLNQQSGPGMETRAGHSKI